MEQNTEVLNALASILYDRYGRSTGYKNFQGNPMPEWEDLPPGVVKAWEAVANSVWPGALTDSLTMGQAIHAMKEGERVCRKGWNGKGMWLYYVPANSYPAQTEAAKKEFGRMVPYGAYIAMKTAQGNVVPWLASQTDLLAEDYMIVRDETE